MFNQRLALSALLLGAMVSNVEAKILCTAIVEADTGRILKQEGLGCAARVTPASTFKIALSLMGFDAGFLKDEHSPTLNFQAGDPDWGGEEWHKPTDPERWMKYSVVWFSQRVTHALGQGAFEQYVNQFEYGNRNVSGDTGTSNALDRAWLSSSLRISPMEQVAFLRKVINRQLPVTNLAYDMTTRITANGTLADGWELHGKTGTGAPGTTKADGSWDQAHSFGWYVGWVTKGPKTLVFARLIQDEKMTPGSAGIRARDSMLSILPPYLKSTPK